MTGERKPGGSTKESIASRPTALPVPGGAAAADAAGDELATRVRAEQIALLYARTPPVLFMSVLFSTAVAVALAQVVDGGKVLIWWVAANAVPAVRYILIRRYRRVQPAPEAAGAWFTPFVLMCLVSGAMWGLMGTWLFPHDDVAYQAMVLEFLVGISAVALFSYGGLTIAYAATILPILLPPAVYVLSLGGDPHFMEGMGLLLFAVVAVAYSYRYQGETGETMRLRFLNERIARERESALLAAERTSEVKSQFLANMSHEIRTPLNGILGMAQLLAASKLDEDQHFQLDMVRRSGEHLLVLINDILDLSRIEAGKINFERTAFELRKAVSEVTSLLAPVAAGKGLALDVALAADAPAWVNGDAARVKQVLHNLLGNAIKFTRQGRVRIEVARARGGEDGLLSFDISDTGPGIPQEYLESVFEPFRQLESPSAKSPGGSGLGLAISRQLAHAMGGDIRCESKPGAGTTFRFTARLPETAALADASAPQAGAHKGPAHKLAGRVLLAEDNEVNALVAKMMLESMGLEVKLVDNGRTALEQAIAGNFDIVLMDCQMPEMDGFEATRRIRDHERVTGRKRMPIVALTASAIRGDRERCLEAGMDDYLSKPFTAPELKNHLDRWIEAADVTGTE